MPSNTPVLALPYPVPADTVDVPRDIKALADKLDTLQLLRPPIVTTLPVAPVDGQECYFQHASMAASGAIWHLRYRAASASPYRWEYVGGAAMQETIAAQESTAFNLYVSLTTFGPNINLVLAGEYDITFGANIQCASAQAAYMAPGVGVPSTDAFSVMTFSPTAAISAAVARTLRATAAAGVAVTAGYRTTGGTAFFEKRFLSIVPVRVG